MTLPAPPPLYESEAVRAVTGPALRPGGLELTREALSLSPLPPGAAVLDVGCGLGATVEFLRQEHGLRAVGLDPSAPLLRQARECHPQAVLLRGRAERLPFPDQGLAGLFCECVLSLTRDQGQVLREFHRVLGRGGKLFLTDLYLRRPEAAGPGLDLPAACCLQGARSRESVEGCVRQAGFEVLLFEDHSRLLKQLAARLVFAHGSLKNFWSFFTPAACGQDFTRDAALARPGYFLLLAEKGEKHE
ncbi:MAG: methyltransferase domain-containing protein [Pseudomonadota bacterium]